MSTLLAPTVKSSHSPAEVAAATEAALSRIPPLWPLRHFVAVNPFAGLVDRRFPEACDLLQRVVGGAPLLPARDYLAAHAAGRITRDDLLVAGGTDWTPERLVQELAGIAGEEAAPGLATVADLLDQRQPRAHWSTFVAEEISKWCAVRFDENQTTWNSPWREDGLYAGWRAAAVHDRNPEAFGLAGFRAFVAALPEDAAAAIATCLGQLDPRSVPLVDFLHGQLASIPGWAGHVQYRVREEAMRGRRSSWLQELLAIRLAYDAALYAAFARDGVFRADWRHQPAGRSEPRRFALLARWQLAYEAGYQRDLAQKLLSPRRESPAGRPEAQAVFCIDVRSEVFRRHLEAAWSGVRTLGFAGFFGFPVAHQPAGAPAPTSRCPVLLVPPVETTEPLPPERAAAVARDRAEAGAWKAFQNSAASCFTFVETAGLAFGAALGRFRPAPSCSRAAPAFAAHFCG